MKAGGIDEDGPGVVRVRRPHGEGDAFLPIDGLNIPFADLAL